MRSRKTPNASIGPGIACARAGHLGNQGRKIKSPAVARTLVSAASRLISTLIAALDPRYLSALFHEPGLDRVTLDVKRKIPLAKTSAVYNPEVLFPGGATFERLQQPAREDKREETALELGFHPGAM
jgi:hypothetical protein